MKPHDNSPPNIEASLHRVSKGAQITRLTNYQRVIIGNAVALGSQRVSLKPEN